MRKYWNDREGAPLKCDSCGGLLDCCGGSTRYKTVCTAKDSWVRLQRKEYWDVYETIWKVRKARFLGALLQ